MFRLSFLLLILSVVTDWASSLGHFNIELNPQTICTVPFRTGHISVWEHAKDPGRYYAMPLAELVKDSARVRKNIITGQNTMTFDILMWSLQAKGIIMSHIKQYVNSTVTLPDIEMLPMESIRIVWRNSDEMSSDFSLHDNWKSNTHLPTIIAFQFSCSSADRCNELLRSMKLQPELFNFLEIEFILNGQETVRRLLSITGDHVMKGRLFTQLSNMPNTVGPTRYLTSADMKEITQESVTMVTGSLATDAGYVDTGDELRLGDILNKELNKFEVLSSDFEPHMWDSVFWDSLWTRPDKITSFLNKALTVDTKDQKYFNENENTNSSSGEGKGGFDLLKIFKLSGGGKSSSSGSNRIKVEDMLKVIKEKNLQTEFTGEIFKVKPMKLFRINLSAIHSSGTIAASNVQIRKYETVQVLKVRVTRTGSSTSVTGSALTPEDVESRLGLKIKQLEANLNKTGDSLNEKIDDLSTETKSKQNELLAKDSSLEKRLDGHSTTLGKNSAAISAVPDWPTRSFCILSNGACPAGFTRHEGHAKAIKLYSAGYPTYMKPVVFGNSQIRCHICSHNDAELIISACCK